MTFQRVSASANPNMGMPYPDDGGSYEQVPLRGVTRARALILPHSFACYCFSIPKPAMCRRENVSLTWLIYNMLKNFPTESFFQNFLYFFLFLPGGLTPAKSCKHQHSASKRNRQRHLCMQDILCRWESNNSRFRSYVPAVAPNPLQASILICPDSSFFYTFFSPFLRIISASAFF